MTTFFVDSSALGRRYLTEIGSAWVLSWILPSANNVIVVSELASIEMPATFARLVRQKLLQPTDATNLEANFLLHAEEEYLTILIDRAIVTQARKLVRTYSLRTLDAIQLACALKAVTLLNQPPIFISGDKQLLVAAVGEGFANDNPYLHP